MAENGQKDLLTLVLRSRKALDHTKTLCLRADTLAKESTAVALDLVAVDAKVRWIAEVIGDQFKLVNNVARGLTQQRLKLEQEEWDAKRKEKSWALDSLLESFGKQLVPPSFYETSSGSSLFGSQHSDEGQIMNEAVEPVPKVDPIAKPHNNRSKWRSLRDFVDEPAIEDATERMESDRNALEDLLESTSSQTQSLDEKVQGIKAALPNIKSPVLPSVQEWLRTQEADLNRMAQLLLDVTRHFDQMQSALADHDAGEIVGEEDMEVLEGDTEQLPSIIEETEQSLEKIEMINGRLKDTRDACDTQFASQQSAISALEALGVEMAELAEHHRVTELEAASLQGVLQNHLTALGELYNTYINYRAAYGTLVQEMDRRRRYRDAVEGIIRGMNAQLQALRSEEMSHREQFVKTEGPFLPEDLCPFVGEMPTVFEVTPTSEEVSVAVDSRYVKEVQDFIAGKH